MSDQSPLRLWLMRASFVALALVILFFQLLPLDTAPRGWAGPDLLLALAFAWSLRRPEYVPPLMLAGVFLLFDLLLQRPPGLWALLMLIGCERLKTRGRTLRDGSFGAEMVAVIITAGAIVLTYRFVLVLFLVPVPMLRLSMTGLASTLLCYPLVAVVTHWLFGVRRPGPGEFDVRGGRI